MAEHDDGDLTIKVNDKSLGGWQDIIVQRGIEICPSMFSIGFTEKFSEDSDKVVVQPGDACVVQIGGDTVLTGYVDRLMPRIGRGTHSVYIAGRSKSQDLVDSSAEWPGGQIKGSSALQIAQKLASIYKGISVEGQVDTGPPIPQYNLNIGESPYALIERYARFRGLLIYDLPNGNITLAQAGSDSMGSGFTQGENIQSADAEFSIDQRFSDYEAFITGVDTFQDLGSGGNLLATVQDSGVKRHRLKTIISEGGALGNDVAKKRAFWEAARRAGRGNVISITTDSWRDTNGKLWTPNATVTIDAPALKLPSGTTWVIAQVTHRRNNKDGTIAEVICMPKDAFLPEPINLLPPGVPGEIGTGQ